MEEQPADNVTKLLSDWSGGDQKALEQLLPLVYAELRRIARRHWSGQRDSAHTLQPTVLIHEAYLKLLGGQQADRTFQNRNHFYAVASMAMRQVLVNHAQASLAAKRGGGAANAKVPLDEGLVAAVQQEKEASEVLALNEALQRLSEMDPRKGRVVELRYFAGLSIEETAAALGISNLTVSRDWQAARAWLARELGPGSSAVASIGPK